MKTTITKILDIPRLEFEQDFISSLESCSAYSDNVEQQDIYNSFDLLFNGLFSDVFSPEHKIILGEIEALCVANDCSYFRLTY